MSEDVKRAGLIQLTAAIQFKSSVDTLSPSLAAMAQQTTAIVSSFTVLHSSIIVMGASLLLIGRKLGLTAGAATKLNQAYLNNINAQEKINTSAMKSLTVQHKQYTAGKVFSVKQKQRNADYLKSIKKQAKNVVGFGLSMIKFQLLMAPVAAVLGTMLEPLEIITPILESWGSILATGLMPAMLPFMDVMIAVTPFITILADAVTLLTMGIFGWLAIVDKWIDIIPDDELTEFGKSLASLKDVTDDLTQAEREELEIKQALQRERVQAITNREIADLYGGPTLLELEPEWML